MTINQRASRKQRSLIARAAEALANAKNRSDLLLDASCREAESVLLDRRCLMLDAAAFVEFTAMLDAPPATNLRLHRC